MKGDAIRFKDLWQNTNHCLLKSSKIQGATQDEGKGKKSVDSKVGKGAKTINKRNGPK